MTWYLIYFLSCPIIIDWILQKMDYKLSKIEFITLCFFGWLIIPLAIIQTIIKILKGTNNH